MTVLLFGEHLKEFPLVFQTLWDKLKEKGDVCLNESIYLAVLYLFFESGFLLCHEKCQSFDTTTYNNIAIQAVADLSLDEIYKKETKNNSVIFSSHLRIGAFGNSEVVLLGYPSANSLSKYMVVNALLKHPNYLVSYCFKTVDFISQKPSRIVFNDAWKLSLIVKNELAIPVRDTFMLYKYVGVVPCFQAMPTHIMDIIYKKLPIATQNKLTQALKMKNL